MNKVSKRNKNKKINPNQKMKLRMTYKLKQKLKRRRILKLKTKKKINQKKMSQQVKKTLSLLLSKNPKKKLKKIAIAQHQEQVAAVAKAPIQSHLIVMQSQLAKRWKKLTTNSQ